MKIHKIAGVLRALQSVTNLGSKCNQTPPLSNKAEYYSRKIEPKATEGKFVTATGP